MQAVLYGEGGADVRAAVASSIMPRAAIVEQRGLGKKREKGEDKVSKACGGIFDSGR